MSAKAASINSRDIVIVSAFVVLIASLVVAIVMNVLSHSELNNMRDQAMLLESKLQKLESSYEVVKKYTGTFSSLAQPQDRPWLKDAEDLTMVKPSNPDFLNMSLSAKSLSPRAGDLARYDRMVHRVDSLASETDVIVGRLNVMAVVLAQHKNLIRSIPSMMPTKGVVSSEYGSRLSPFGGAKMMHAGIDIAAKRGTPILAPADGVVTFAGRFNSMGNTIVIDHGSGVLTRYGHASRLLVKKGQRVTRDMKIALVGNTGNSTGPHLHYEVWVNNNPVNPRNFFFDVTNKPADVAGLDDKTGFVIPSGMGGH